MEGFAARVDLLWGARSRARALDDVRWPGTALAEEALWQMLCRLGDATRVNGSLESTSVWAVQTDVLVWQAQGRTPLRAQSVVAVRVSVPSGPHLTMRI
jgi:hypothetical protein